jgi:5-methylcytosine-specific restriction endonuclease McrA
MRRIKHVMALYMAQGGLCFYCYKPMNITPWQAYINPNGYSRDHFVPKSKGGGKGFNLVLCHHECNLQKGCKDPDQDLVKRYEEFVPKAREIKHLVEHSWRTGT